MPNVDQGKGGRGVLVNFILLWKQMSNLPHQIIVSSTTLRMTWKIWKRLLQEVLHSSFPKVEKETNKSFFFFNFLLWEQIKGLVHQIYKELIN